eukprot:Skav207595  [mRNA]  locus=scaffold2450:118837:123588:+ [translate_table: standard]
MSIGSVPTQPYMGSGVQVAPGGAPRIGSTQVSPGTTIKWNQGALQFEPSFPKPAGQKESFVMSDPEIEERDCCSGYCCRWISDHWAKLGLLLVALGVFVLTILALIQGLNTLSSNGFFYYSKFAWEQWFPSFFVMLMLLSLVAMAMVFFAGFISLVEKRRGLSFSDKLCISKQLLRNKHNKHNEHSQSRGFTEFEFGCFTVVTSARALVRAFYISSLTLGAIMLSLALSVPQRKTCSVTRQHWQS